MTDKKKTEDLKEQELDQVTGGLYSTSSMGTELKKGKRKTPTVKSPNDKGDGFIAFGEETTT